MANGLDAADWSVKWDGRDGTVAYQPYAGRFPVLRTGVVRLIWTSGPPPGPDHGEIQRAALQAADRIVNPE